MVVSDLLSILFEIIIIIILLLKLRLGWIILYGVALHDMGPQQGGIGPKKRRYPLIFNLFFKKERKVLSMHF